METDTEAFRLTFESLIALVLGIGALGAAAYGLVETLGKAMAGSRWELDPETREARVRRTLFVRFRGLPYVGFTAVQHFMKMVDAPLRAAYGNDVQLIVRGQYRDGRVAGAAPTTIRQGVRLGLSLLNEDAIRALIRTIWGENVDTERLVAAIAARNAAPEAHLEAPGGVPMETAERLMSNFVTVLDARMDAAFSLAEERYLAAARTWAALTSIGLALGLNYIATLGGAEAAEPALPWEVALLVGVAAVPLAPIAKDLARGLSEAVGAFRSITAAR